MRAIQSAAIAAHSIWPYNARVFREKRMPVRRSWISVRRFCRRILRQDDPPERIARGVSAGLFAGAIPLPGVQIPISLFLAWVVRGNAVV